MSIATQTTSVAVADPAPQGEPPARESISSQRSRSASLLALVDQAVVSGSNLATTVLVGRLCGKHELGIYSLGFTVVLAVLIVQDALIAMPYSIFGCRLPREGRREYGTSALIQSGLLSIVASIGLAIAAGLVVEEMGSLGLGSVLLVLAVVIPLILLREFVRKFSFAQLQLSIALRTDVLATIFQFSLLGILILTGHISAAGAQAMLGIAAGIAALTWLIRSRGEFGPWKHRLRADMSRGWGLGRWILISQFAVLTQTFGLNWILQGLYGATVVGTYAACLSIVLVCNPLLLAVGNIVGPKIAWAFAHEGESGMRRIVRRETLFLGSAMAVYVVGAALFGGMALTKIYGPDYSGYGTTIACLAVGVFISSLGMPADNGLRVIEQPSWSVIAGVAGATVMITSTLLTTRWGLPGAAWSYIAGHITGSTIRWLAFLMVKCPEWQGIPE